jgi:hypothetical protein
VRTPFSRLIYPMPATGGLGIDLTLDLAGQARFGPDVEWVETIGYDVDPQRADSFYAAVRTYWPSLPDGALQPAYAGIRPKIARPGGSSTDFLIQTEYEHGVCGLINLFGIDPRPDGEPRDRRGDRGTALNIRFDRNRRQVSRSKRLDYDRTTHGNVRGQHRADGRSGVGRERAPQAPTENPEALQVVGGSRHYVFARHSRCGVSFS